jgi:hypothetical protein
MSEDQCHELEEIGNMLIEAREKLERLQSSGNLPETNRLHAAISYARWLCYRVCEEARRQGESVLRARH